MKFSGIIFAFAVFSFQLAIAFTDSRESFGFGGGRICGYQCSDLFTCIPLYELCDGIWNCPAGDDELDPDCSNPFLTGFGRRRFYQFGNPIFGGFGTGTQSRSFSTFGSGTQSRSFAGSGSSISSSNCKSAQREVSTAK